MMSADGRGLRAVGGEGRVVKEPRGAIEASVS